jgi:hypothetical protein
VAEFGSVENLKQPPQYTGPTTNQASMLDVISRLATLLCPTENAY